MASVFSMSCCSLQACLELLLFVGLFDKDFLFFRSGEILVNLSSSSQASKDAKFSPNTSAWNTTGDSSGLVSLICDSLIVRIRPEPTDLVRSGDERVKSSLLHDLPFIVAGY
jgi:hypothetical protein